LDHLKNTSSFNYSNLQWIVFDEADMILELGFGKALEEILEFLGSRAGVDQTRNKKADVKKDSRQNLLLSATLNEKVNRLANLSLDNPVRVGLDENAVSSENEELLIKDSVDNYNLPEQLLQRYVKGKPECFEF
jgi:ATP-dependent RNA helicase DDX31/DBP7